MRVVAVVLSVLVAMQFTCLTLPAGAADVSYSPPTAAGVGGIKGAVPVNKIGALLLVDAVALLNNDTIEVKGKQNHSSDTKTLLSGTIFKTDVAGTSTHPVVHGMAYFNGGPSLSHICKSGGLDRVDTTNGEQVTGQIASVDPDGVTVQGAGGSRHIPSNLIRHVHSSCVFEFSVPCAVSTPVNTNSTFHGNCDKITFNNYAPLPDHGKTTKTTTKTTGTAEGHTTGKVVAITLCMLGIATAIAVPIAVGIATRHHHHHNNTPIFFPPTRSSYSSVP